MGSHACVCVQIRCSSRHPVPSTRSLLMVDNDIGDVPRWCASPNLSRCASTGLRASLPWCAARDSRAGMDLDDIIDPRTVRSIEREHDACVIDEAYEIHVADQAATSLAQVLAAHPLGSHVSVRLSHGDVFRGTLSEPVIGWLSIDQGSRQVLISHQVVTRIVVRGVHAPSRPHQAPRTLASVLRERARISDVVRLRLTDGSRLTAGIGTVGADFATLSDGSLVPFRGIDVCELT